MTGQTQKDLGSNPVKWRFSTHERKTRPDQHSVDQHHHLNCCQPLRSHYCVNQTCKLWEETLTNLRISGAHYSWAHSGSLFPKSSVTPSITLLPSFHKWWHYWTYDRVGSGGHGIYGFHQTFNLRFNSTKFRVEWPDTKGPRIESSKVEILNPWAETRPDQHSVDQHHHLNCCQPLRSH